jgi:hypothetical protein
MCLSWDEPHSDGGMPITNYRIYRGTSPGNEIFLAEIGNTTSFIDTDYSKGVNYYYKITAVNGVGEGPFSEEISIYPLNSHPPEGDSELYWLVWIIIAFTIILILLGIVKNYNLAKNKLK